MSEGRQRELGRGLVVMKEHYMARGGCRAKAFMRLQGHSGWDLSPSNDHINRDQRMQALQNNVL